jgi:hypothetical protein
MNIIVLGSVARCHPPFYPEGERRGTFGGSYPCDCALRSISVGQDRPLSPLPTAFCRVANK